MKSNHDSGSAEPNTESDFGLFAALFTAVPVGVLIWGGIFWLLV
jgi:hypothetical protein